MLIAHVLRRQYFNLVDAFSGKKINLNQIGDKAGFPKSGHIYLYCMIKIRVSWCILVCGECFKLV